MGCYLDNVAVRVLEVDGASVGVDQKIVLFPLSVQPFLISSKRSLRPHALVNASHAAIHTARTLVAKLLNKYAKPLTDIGAEICSTC